MADLPQKNSTDQLLPWYLNKTLSAEEHEEVVEYIKGKGKAGEAELLLLRRISEQAKSDDGIQSPGELGWKRLQKQVQNEAKQVSSAVPPIASAPKWYRPALAAALAVIVVQGSFLLGEKPASLDDVYQPLSSTPSAVPQLQVQFTPTATEQQIREVLRANKLSIVSGPSAIGIYHLRVLSGAAKDTSAAGKNLGAYTDIVLHVTVE